MNNKYQRGLGRGLESLLRNTQSTSDTLTATTAVPPSDSVAIDLLQAGRYQPRQQFSDNAIQELAESIHQQGIIQPIIVRPTGGNRYEIIAGERRWRAANLAGLATVPVIIKKVDDKTASAMALIENVQREDLNPLDQAVAFHRLTEEFSLTHQKIAELVGKSRVAISNILRLLNLSNTVKTYLANGELEMGHCRALLSLDDGQQQQLAHTIIDKQLSVREAERLVRQAIQPKTPKKHTKPDPDTVVLQQQLSEKLGAKVAIRHNQKGAGKLTISYTTLEELQGVLEHIQ